MAMVNQVPASNGESSGHQWITLSKDGVVVDVRSQAHDAGLRVCDSCRIRKRKCDFKRPICATCQANNLACRYTSHKRKPGPRKGARCNPGERRMLKGDGHSNINVVIPSAASNNIPTPATIFTPNIIAGDMRYSTGVDEQPCSTGRNPQVDVYQNMWPNIQILTFLESDKGVADCHPSIPSLSNELEIHLLDLYFAYIQPMYPLFRRQTLLEHQLTGSLPQSLKMIMFALAARFSSRKSDLVDNLGISEHEICTIFAAVSKSAHSMTLKSASNEFTLTQVQAAYLLCIYDLTLSLDRKAWIQVGQLTRMAHICGLDQIEGKENCIFYRPGMSHSTHLEEWRHLWWNIWRLDATANSLNSSPCSTDMYVPGTALVSTPGACLADSGITNTTTPEFCKVYLEGEVSTCWKTMQAFLENPSSSDLMYTAAFTLVREATAIQRLTRFKMTSQTHARLLDLDRACVAVQLALPPWYSNSSRSISTGESTSCHLNRLEVHLIVFCARLSTNLCAARIALSVSNMIEFQEKWQTCLSTSQKIIHTIQSFDPGYFWTLDPIAGFIPWLSGVVFALEVIASPLLDESTKRSLLNSIDLTILFLRQIGSHWNIGTVLADSLEKLIGNRNKYHAASYKDLLLLLTQLEMPMNQQNRRSEAAQSSLINTIMTDLNVEMDPLSFLTFENSSYDPQMDLETITGLDDYLYG